MKQMYMACIDCLYALQAEDPSLDSVWQWLIDGRCYENPYVMVSDIDDSETFLYLEKHGYIVTHETFVLSHWCRSPQRFIVRVNGFRQGSQLVCVHRHLP